MQNAKMLHDFDNFFHFFLFTGESTSKTNAAMKAIRVAFSRIVALCVVGGNGIRTGFVFTLQSYDFFSYYTSVLEKNVKIY